MKEKGSVQPPRPAQALVSARLPLFHVVCTIALRKLNEASGIWLLPPAVVGCIMSPAGRLSQHIFLIDGGGALLSAGVVFVFRLQGSGLPDPVLVVLLASALGFSTFSLTCHFRKPLRWPLFLRTVASANLMYGAATLALVFLYFDVTPLLQRYFFIAEAGVLAVLAFVEFRLASAR